jgi:alpha-ketoglutarate-dependent taurine dioxygenase
MKCKIHANGWTAIVEDFDLASASQQELFDLSKLCAKHTCVKIPDQHLTIDQEVRIIKSFKNPYQLFDINHPKFTEFSLDKEGFVGRVTANAIAGHKEEMLWHNEMPAIRIGSDIAWLYAEYGVNGSVTVWNNTALAYADLDSVTKNRIKDYKCIYFGNVNHSVARTENNFNNRHVYELAVPLVYTNHLGVTGLHFSLHQFERFEGMTREESLAIADPLFKFVTQDKYCYFHEWKDGDVSLSDQWLGVHKRLHFENMVHRLVHRATFNYPESI